MPWRRSPDSVPIDIVRAGALFAGDYAAAKRAAIHFVRAAELTNDELGDWRRRSRHAIVERALIGEITDRLGVRPERGDDGRHDESLQREE